MSTRERTSIKELEQRKRRIETELNQIHNNLDDSVNKMKDSVLSVLIPAEKIRKNPFKSIGIAFVTGLVFGLPKLRKKTGSRSHEQYSTKSPGLTSLVLDEFKRIAARRAVQYVMDAVDKGTAEKHENEDRNQEDK